MEILANIPDKAISSLKKRQSYLRLVIIGFVLSFLPVQAEARQKITDEYTIKAKFIWNFIRFTQWPDNLFARPNDPIVVNVMYDIPAAENLIQRLDGLPVIREENNVRYRREISVKRVQMATEILTCHVFYFATNDKVMIKKQLAAIGSQPILTIGETEGFEALCGIINFFPKQNRQAFRVNLGAARRSGLKLSSQILRSAEIYDQDQTCFHPDQFNEDNQLEDDENDKKDEESEP